MTIFCDEEGMFPLGAGLSIYGSRCPMVFGIDISCAHAGIDHRLDGKCHSGRKGDFYLVLVVGNLRRFMKMNAGSMPDELIDDGTS